MTPSLDGTPLRRAAFTVYALPQADRAWMLASLSPADRESLTGLLVELEALGIPPDPGFLAVVPPESATEPGEPGRWPDALDDAGVCALQRVLAREPSSVARALLSIRAWKWRAPLLAAMDERTRAEVEAQPISGTIRTHVSEALLNALKARLDCEPLPAPEKTSRWKTSWVRIRRGS